MSHEAPTSTAIEDFIARWSGGGGTEKANYQLFLTELIALRITFRRTGTEKQPTLHAGGRNV